CGRVCGHHLVCGACHTAPHAHDFGARAPSPRDRFCAGWRGTDDGRRSCGANGCCECGSADRHADRTGWRAVLLLAASTHAQTRWGLGVVAAAKAFVLPERTAPGSTVVS